MMVELLHHSPLWLASHAIRMSHDNHDKSDTIYVCSVCGTEYEPMYPDNYCSSCDVSMPEKIIGEKDKALIARVGNKMKHKSVLEQLVYWFDIDGISRACLQELARHRTARLTVKSSRYTLKELYSDDVSYKRMMSFLVPINKRIDGYNCAQLRSIILLMQLPNVDKTTTDELKFMLPEAFKTKLQWQVDGRNLQNFLALRTSKDALREIQILARSIYNALPSEHKYLYSEYVMDNTNDSVIDDNTETTDCL